ncbi:MAG: helix-turn-helix transcriptional regulator [Fibrobacter sp.]|nr:helix-turn-helix transcriptional regulator [Fibrobacter sp.]
MEISYNRLWKKLIDEGWKKTDLIHRAGITGNVLAKMSKNRPISMESIYKICEALNCDIGDVVQMRKSDNSRDFI